jgi:hypothetical protein
MLIWMPIRNETYSLARSPAQNLGAKDPIAAPRSPQVGTVMAALLV